MDKMEEGSPYLQRPLRSLDQALRDQADVAQKDREPSPKPLARAAQLSFRLDELSN